MANHVRRQIRDALVTRLTNLATTGTRVSKSRVFPLGDDLLPGLCIYSNQESSEDASVGLPRLQRRKLELFIEGYAKDANQVDDVLDQIAKEVESAIGAEPTLGGIMTELHLTETRLDMVDGDKNVGCIRLTYEGSYRVKETAPDVFV